MDNKIARIFRHEPPTQQDTSPYGTDCKVDHDDYFEIYLQISVNEELPIWIFIGDYEHGVDEQWVQDDINGILQSRKNNGKNDL